jgi:hypothetical protein
MPFDPDAIERLTPRVREEVQEYYACKFLADIRRSEYQKPGWPRTARWWLNDPETKLARELRQRDAS